MRTVNILKLLHDQRLTSAERNPNHEPGQVEAQKRAAQAIEDSKPSMPEKDAATKKKVRVIRMAVTDQDTDDTRFSVPSTALFAIKLKG